MSFPIIKSHLSLSFVLSRHSKSMCRPSAIIISTFIHSNIFYVFIIGLFDSLPIVYQTCDSSADVLVHFFAASFLSSSVRFHIYVSFLNDFCEHWVCVCVCVMHTFVALKRSNLFGHRLHQCERRWGETVTVPGIANEGFSVSFAFINFFIRPRFLPVPLFPFFSRLPLFPSFLVWFAHLSGGREKKCVFSLKVPSHKSKCKNIFVENYASYYTSVL